MTHSDQQTKQNDMSPEEARAALAWLYEMGADEILSETPVNRMTSVAAVATPPSPAAKVTKVPPAPQQASDMRLTPSECLTIPDIEAALSQLDDFALKKTASNLCFAGGNLTSQVLVIGDVPGRDEDIEGRVFAGSHGLLLEKMLAAIGLSFETVVLLNFIPWRPPGNRMVTDAEIAMCRPYILRAVEILAPRFILSLGQLPMQALLGRKESLMASRGKWFAYGSSNIPLLASFHPSYLTLQPAQKRLAWRDLLTFREALHG